MTIFPSPNRARLSLRRSLPLVGAIVVLLSLGRPVDGQAQDLAFTAAGVMPYAVKDGNLLFLVGGEYRRDCFGGRPGFCWSTFVGRRNPSEDHPAQTATREFHEETRFAFSSVSTGNPVDPHRLSGSSPLPTRKRGIYVYLAEVPFIAPDAIGLGQTRWTSEKSAYCWITPAQLLEAVDSPPHRLPATCGDSEQRLFDVFRNDMAGDSAIRRAVETLARTGDISP
jgi:8-oxo-dGTP pyrophosphatase MutT (NUDIX family)